MAGPIQPDLKAQDTGEDKNQLLEYVVYRLKKSVVVSSTSHFKQGVLPLLLRLSTPCVNLKDFFMDVQVLSSQNDLPIAPSSVENIVSNFISFYKLNYNEVSIHFVDTETICDLHGEFFNDPSITDCISFPMDEAFDEGYLVMGDIFICPKTAITYTTVNGGDSYQETTLYLVHGLLHLIGYDDIDEADEKLMRQEESNFFNYLNTKKLALHS